MNKDTKKNFTYKYPRAMITVDAVIFRSYQNDDEVLLICRKNPPFKGEYALPGGFIEMDEDLIESAKRELEEETGLKMERLEQIGAFGKPNRDPRGRSVTIAFAGVYEGDTSPITGADDAAEASFRKLSQTPKLAFDHDEIIKKASFWLHKKKY